MITPSFALTATERVLPKLALDFTTASLDSRVTFTRALDTATRVNSSGLIETVLANTPRFDYTLNTGGACKGLLIEEARTNLIVGSAGSGGTKIGTTTITLNSATAPNGLTEATLLSGIAVGAANGIRFRVAGTIAGNYTCSIYIKATANSIGKDMRIYFEGNGGVYQSFGLLDTTLTGSWQRVTITGNSNGTSTFLDFVCSRGGSAQADEYYIWGAQMEAGAFATSIIPTTSASLTRNADVATMTGTNFSSWYNASEGTFIATGYTSSATAGQMLTTNQNVFNGNELFSLGRYLKGGLPTGGFSVNASGQYLVLGDQNNGNSPVNSFVKMGGSYITANCAGKVGIFATETSTAAVTMPASQVQLQIGNLQNNTYWNGWISKINYYNIRVTNNELAAFTY